MGAASRTRPTTTAVPVNDWAPSWLTSWPTWSEIVAPRGIATSSTGSDVTLVRNQAWSSHSFHHWRNPNVLRKASRVMAAMPPATVSSFFGGSSSFWPSAGRSTSTLANARPPICLRQEAELYDGSDLVTLVWLGRRHIPGIQPGRAMTARGRVAVRDNRKVIYNPFYELEAQR